MEAAAHLIEDPAARHGVERALGDARGIGARASGRLIEQEQQLRLRRELGRLAEAAVDRVLQLDQIGGRARGRVGADRDRFGVRRRHLAHRVGEAGGGDLELGAVAAPALRHHAQQLGELIARQVGGAEERTARRREEALERPAAAAPGELHRGHVDVVEIRDAPRDPP